MSGVTFLKQNPSKLGWESPIRKMVCGLSFLLWLTLLQTSLAVNVPGPNGTVITQILSATSSNPEVKVVEDRDLGKILVYPPQPKEFTVEIIARIMYPDDQYLEKISTVMVGGAGVTIESSEIRNSLILATLKVAPGASGGRFSITYENEDNPNHKGCNVRLLPMEIKLTDKATESDKLPYVAYSPEKKDKNKKLCLRADPKDENAKVVIEVPSIKDAELLKKLSWKVIKKPSDEEVKAGDLETNSKPEIELTLKDGGDILPEQLFEFQIGMTDAGAFKAVEKIGIHLIRDRLNCWFRSFSADKEWKAAKPEPRKDTGDYPAKKAVPYKREALQSIYHFLISDKAYGSITKVSWVKSDLSCFGEFHEFLKKQNGDNPLCDLSLIAKIKMAPSINLDTFNKRYAALRYTQARQTTYGSDANPTLRAVQHPERVTWAKKAAIAVGDAKLTGARILSLWAREGSMAVNSEDQQTNSNNLANFSVWPLRFNAASTAAPASVDDAKTVYIYDVAYICLGSDFLLKKSGGADNQPDLRDYTAALTHFRNVADATGGAGTGNRILGHLTANAVAGGGYTIAADGKFYEEMLTLVGKHYLSVWQAEGPDATYQAYNMGVAKFNQMKATLGNANYPERARLGLVDWAIHYEIRTGEWDQPRDFAHKFFCYRKAFEEKYP